MKKKKKLQNIILSWIEKGHISKVLWCKGNKTQWEMLLEEKSFWLQFQRSVIVYFTYCVLLLTYLVV